MVLNGSGALTGANHDPWGGVLQLRPDRGL